MPNSFRAKQFMPFDALKGFKEELRKKETEVKNMKQLEEDFLYLLDIKIKDNIDALVEVLYFCDNEYKKIQGIIKKDGEDIKINGTIVPIKFVINVEVL